MRRANNWEAPRWVRFYVISATRVGDGWLWYAMGLAIVMFGGENRFEALGAAGVVLRTEHPVFHLAEAPHGPPPALPDRTPLLGYTASAGSILVSLRPHHDGLRGGHSALAVLSDISPSACSSAPSASRCRASCWACIS